MSAPRHTHRGDARPYRTKDGSTIRELLHPVQHAMRLQSLAEANIARGAKTLLHRHRTTEEIYHVVEGSGLMTLDGETFPVAAGDSICIAPGSAHCIENNGSGVLRILCCCSPAYRHDDTELLETR